MQLNGRSRTASGEMVDAATSLEEAGALGMPLVDVMATPSAA